MLRLLYVYCCLQLLFLLHCHHLLLLLLFVMVLFYSYGYGTMSWRGGWIEIYCLWVSVLYYLCDVVLYQKSNYFQTTTRIQIRSPVYLCLYKQSGTIISVKKKSYLYPFLLNKNISTIRKRNMSKSFNPMFWQQPLLCTSIINYKCGEESKET